MTTDSSPIKPRGLFHDLFDAVVVLKGLNGLAEIASGGVLLLIKTGTIMEWVQWITRSELLQDPHDLLATHLEHWASTFGHDAQVFAGLYLLAHGIVKVTITILLFKEKTWAFPLAIFLFSALVMFSLHRLSINWSWALAGFVVFDLFTIAVIANEWRTVGKLKSSNA